MDGPADTAAVRIDVAEWMATLLLRDRAIAGTLGVRRLVTQAQKTFDKSVAGLTGLDASCLIDPPTRSV